MARASWAAFLLGLASSAVAADWASAQAAPSRVEQPSPEEVQTEGRKFLDALLSGDPARLAQYGGLPSDGGMHPDLETFIYGPANRDPYLSLLEIAKEGPLEIMLDSQSRSEFTVLFYIPAHRDRMTDLDFLQENWMVTYFACEFDKEGGEWRLRHGVCFDETDGPYPYGYPDP